MRVKQHYSSSAGNLYEIISVSGSKLLIEAGVKWKKILKALEYDLSNIEGCLISHGGHQDHSVAIKDVLRAGIPVYASDSSFEAHGLLNDRRTYPVSNKHLIRLDSFEIFCFDVNHDVPTLGFIVREKATREFLLFCTDTAYITQRFNYPFSIIMLECAYNKEYLQHRVDTKTINEELATRLLTSHMEEKETLRYLQDFCNLSKCKEIHLLHQSADNINKKRIKKTFQEKLFIEVKTI